MSSQVESHLSSRQLCYLDKVKHTHSLGPNAREMWLRRRPCTGKQRIKSAREAI